VVWVVGWDAGWDAAEAWAGNKKAIIFGGVNYAQRRWNRSADRKRSKRG
jgi:hypothetical protein